MKPLFLISTSKHLRCSRFVALASLISTLNLVGPLHHCIAQELIRVTPAVQLIEKFHDAVVPVFTQTSANSFGSGAGVVFHPNGYILTADHVTQEFNGVVLFGLEQAPYKRIGRCPDRDLAIIQVDRKFVTATMPLGRSNDLKAGESILIGGNPSGRGTVFSQGVISAPSIDPSWPNLLVKSMWRNAIEDDNVCTADTTGGRQDFIQFDATSNRGNSGGPLIQMDGQVAGVVVTKSTSEEGINWAIPMDRVRRLIPYLLQPEETHQFSTGIQIDFMAARAIVTSIEPDSSVAKADLRIGDKIVGLNGAVVNSAIDWYCLLHDCRSGEEVSIQIQRDGKQIAIVCELTSAVAREVIAKDVKQLGIECSVYEGRYAIIPDVENLKLLRHSMIDAIDLKQIITEQDETVVVRLKGFIEFPEAGLYRIVLGSDDGSKLYIDERLLIDNDLTHPYQTLSRQIRVGEGLVPFTIDYSEIGGDRGLTLEAFSTNTTPAAKVPLKFYH
jgi:S1-C subfamily serine protease